MALFLKYRYSLSAVDPDKLKNFYVNVLEMRLVVKVDRVDDYGYGIEASPGYKLWIAKHSEVNTRNKDLFRHMLTLYVDDIYYYFDNIKLDKNINLIQKPTIACEGIKGEERIVCTFLDPEKNCIQLMQIL